MNTYKIRITKTGILSGYFIGTELTVSQQGLDRIMENNQVVILEETKAAKPKPTTNRKQHGG